VFVKNFGEIFAFFSKKIPSVQRVEVKIGIFWRLFWVKIDSVRVFVFFRFLPSENWGLFTGNSNGVILRNGIVTPF
jgi:hypothetical protein